MNIDAIFNTAFSGLKALSINGGFMPPQPVKKPRGRVGAAIPIGFQPNLTTCASDSECLAQAMVSLHGALTAPMKKRSVLILKTWRSHFFDTLWRLYAAFIF